TGTGGLVPPILVYLRRVLRVLKVLKACLGIRLSLGQMGIGGSEKSILGIQQPVPRATKAIRETRETRAKMAQNGILVHRLHLACSGRSATSSSTLRPVITMKRLIL